MVNCAYPAHNGMDKHPAIVYMLSPGDKLGRHTRTPCCDRAAQFAGKRGWNLDGYVEVL